jgi:hypothetical protein
MAEDKELLRTFEGPKGKAEVYELIAIDIGRAGVEKVEYEVCFGDERKVVGTMGEAAILAEELTGGH